MRLKGLYTAPLLLLALACGSESVTDPTITGFEPTDDSSSSSEPGGDGESSTNTHGDDSSGSTGVNPEPDTIFDVAGNSDLGAPSGCEGDGEDVLFSHIWIANSPLGSVSKVDTRTRAEIARYYTAPDHDGDPSRTSVNLLGDVAVVNRAGGIVKIAAAEHRCEDRDGDGAITTSSGRDDVLPWSEDECVLWYAELPTKARPVAWTPGELVGEGCEKTLVGASVWSAAPVAGDVHVLLLDGDSGETIETVVLPNIGETYGIYGAAVNKEGDFWGVVYPEGPLVKIRLSDTAVELIDLPVASAYGFTVDGHGRPWVGGFDGVLQRFHPPTHTWKVVDTGGLWSLMRGMTADADGVLWVATLSPSGLLSVDADSGTALGHLGAESLPGVDTPTGASVDADGKVWLVDRHKEGGGAFIYDPADGSVDYIAGLDSPYTYSDMTGWALGNVAGPSG